MTTQYPTGTVTFLFTDIEGSTRLAQQNPDAMPALLARHHEILNQSIKSYNGYVFQIIGDAFCVSFHTVVDGLHAAIEVQRQLQNEEWGDTPIKVRMGIHTGAAQIKDDGQYSGYSAMALTQRLMSAGHGGQILLSDTSENLLHGQLLQDIQLRDLGNIASRIFCSAYAYSRLWNRIYKVNFPFCVPWKFSQTIFRHS